MYVSLPVALMVVTAFAYGILQIIVLVRSSGRVRLAAAVPLLFMIPAAGITAYSFSAGSTLAPLLLLLLSPLSALYLMALSYLGAGRRLRNRL